MLVSITKSTGPPTIRRCSTSSRQQELALSVHRGGLHDAQSPFARSEKARLARFGEDEGLEGPDEKGRDRNDEEDDRDGKDEG
jgi:hypothetical protein